MKKLTAIYKTIKRYRFYGIPVIAVLLLKRKLSYWQLRKMGQNKNSYLKYLREQDLQSLKSIITNLPELPLARHIHEIKKRDLYPGEAQAIINEADRICNNQFNILGSGWITWAKDNRVDWHRDMKNNFTWDKTTFYTDISKIIRTSLKMHNKKQIDAKIPRELSRFYFLFPLFFSFIYTKNDKYLNKIKDLICDWINENPPFYSINWSNAMEAAIRISNWCLIVYSLKPEILRDNDFMKMFYKSLTDHMLYICKNLENIALKNNHYISNITGIYLVNTLFPVFKKSSRWLTTAARELKKELKIQVNPDGGYSENSTAYHRLVTELFFLPLYLAQQFNKDHFQEKQVRILEKMFHFVLNTIKPCGRIIQFGDNDSGRLFKLYNRKSLQQDYLLSLAYGLIEKKTFCIKEFSFDILSYIFFGNETCESYQQESGSIFSRGSNRLHSTGIYTFINNNYYLAVSCMPNNRDGRNIHTHNDKLSFELAYKKYDIIVDPGTYVYGSDQILRNRYRSTLYHNTVFENNMMEQNRLGNSIFSFSNDSTVTMNSCDIDYLDCQHNGFTKQGGHIHRRIFTINDHSLKIEDMIDSAQTSTCSMHFAPEMKLNRYKSGYVIQNQDKDLLKLQIDNSIDIEKEIYKYSPGYGELQEAEKLIVYFKKELSVIFTIIKDSYEDT